MISNVGYVVNCQLITLPEKISDIGEPLTWPTRRTVIALALNLYQAGVKITDWLKWDGNFTVSPIKF